MYKQIEQDEAILEEFPQLTQAELDKVNEFYGRYLFYEQEAGGRRVWTSCCHVDGELFKAEPRTETPTHRQIMTLSHGDDTVCPWCGKTVQVKNRKKLGKKSCKLDLYIPVIFLRASEDGKTVYAQGYWTTKNHIESPAAYPVYSPTRVYRFREGEALQWGIKDFESWQMERSSSKWIQEPFTDGGYMDNAYCPYRVVGIRELQRSFLRYTECWKPLTKEEDDLWSYTGQRKALMRTLGMASPYPRSVEMLIKAGMYSVITDWVYRRKKNADVVKWGEDDPRQALNLNRAELRDFRAFSCNLEILRVYKNIRWEGSRVGVRDAAELYRQLGLDLARQVTAKAKKYKIRIAKLMGYLEPMAGPRCHGGGVTLEYVARYWCDYIDAAAVLKYDLENPIHQMPRDIEEAHNKATGSVQYITDEKRREYAGARYKSLQVKYSFETEHYLIRAPIDTLEIIAEGKALKHCVGGYAERHAEGKTNILFLRDKTAPHIPLVTIEIKDKDLQQVHGYGNEWEACAANPGMVEPKVLYAEILEPWLAWVKAGSRRDKDGRPKMPGTRAKKKEATAA